MQPPSLHSSAEQPAQRDSDVHPVHTSVNAEAFAKNTNHSWDLFLNKALRQEILSDIKRNLPQAAVRMGAIPHSKLRSSLHIMLACNKDLASWLHLRQVETDLQNQSPIHPRQLEQLRQSKIYKVRAASQAAYLKRYWLLRFSDPHCTRTCAYQLPAVYDMDFMTQTLLQWWSPAVLPGKTQGIFMPKQILLQAILMVKVLRRALDRYNDLATQSAPKKLRATQSAPTSTLDEHSGTLLALTGQIMWTIFGMKHHSIEFGWTDAASSAYGVSAEQPA